ncbi:MAG: B12-binding domain-containing radical SAM protein [Deltaproteobacteria bacterium]|nr:B12-binding domain-containing radical SAM protein [Deltaproteobacteria bacterium]
MRVTLVYPSNSEFINRVPLGLLSIASYLKKHLQIEANVVHLGPYIQSEVIQRNSKLYDNCVDFLLEKFPSDVYGFSAIVTTEIPALQIAERLKRKNRGTKIVFGNQWSAVNDVSVMKAFPFIDFIVRGEGEITFSQLIESLLFNNDFYSIEGLTFRKETTGDIVRNCDRKRIQNLDSLSFYDYNLLHPSLNGYAPSKFGGIHGLLEFGRGCPFSCSFCATTRHWTQTISVFSIERTIRDIRTLETQGCQFVEFTYDNFGTRPKEIARFCEDLMVSGVKVRWSVRCRLDCLSDKVISLLKRANCVSILVGLESGSEKVIEKIGKKLSFEKGLKTIEKLLESGITVSSSFVCGMPFEDKDDVVETMKLACVLASYGERAYSTIHFHTPLPGTPVTKQALLSNKIKFSEDSRISPDFSRYLNWVDDSRFPEDQSLIDAFPDLFTGYAYIENENVSAQHYVSLAGYFNVLVRFYPLTILCIITKLEEEGSDFITEFENFIASKGLNARDLLSINSHSIASPKELLGNFVEFFYSIDLCHDTFASSIFDYETVICDFPSQNTGNLHRQIDIEKKVNLNIMVREYDFDVPKVISKMRRSLFSTRNGKNLLCNEKTYLVFSKEGSLIRVYKIGRGLFRCLKFLEQSGHITKAVTDACQALGVEDKSQELYLKNFMSFVTKNGHFFRMQYE